MRDTIDGGYPAGGNMTTNHIETLETPHCLPQQTAFTRQIKENSL